MVSADEKFPVDPLGLLPIRYWMLMAKYGPLLKIEAGMWPKYDPNRFGPWSDTARYVQNVTTIDLHIAVYVQNVTPLDLHMAVYV